MNFLSTQNVNVARFARNVEWDFFDNFHPLCHIVWIYVTWTVMWKSWQKSCIFSVLSPHCWAEHWSRTHDSDLLWLWWFSIDFITWPMQSNMKISCSILQFPGKNFPRAWKRKCSHTFTVCQDPTTTQCLKITQKVSFNIGDQTMLPDMSVLILQ